MLLRFPGIGGTVDASDGHAKELLAAGWVHVEPEAAKSAPTPKRRARKAEAKKTE